MDKICKEEVKNESSFDCDTNSLYNIICTNEVRTMREKLIVILLLESRDMLRIATALLLLNLPMLFAYRSSRTKLCEYSRSFDGLMELLRRVFCVLRAWRTWNDNE